MVAVLEGGDPTVIALTQKAPATTPSIVAFAKNGEVLVGEVAKRQAVTNVDRTIRSVKRHMGTTWDQEIDGKELHRARDRCAHPRQSSSATQRLTSVKTLPTPSSRFRLTSMTPSVKRRRKPVRSRRPLNVLGSSTSRPPLHWHTGSTSQTKSRRSSFDLGGGTFDVSLWNRRRRRRGQVDQW